MPKRARGAGEKKTTIKLSRRVHDMLVLLKVFWGKEALEDVVLELISICAFVTDACKEAAEVLHLRPRAHAPEPS